MLFLVVLYQVKQWTKATARACAHSEFRTPSAGKMSRIGYGVAANMAVFHTAAPGSTPGIRITFFEPETVNSGITYWINFTTINLTEGK